MTEPIRISNSEIQTYRDCRRKWWLAYYRRLSPKTQSFVGPLALGSRIHNALDMYYSTGVPLLDAHSDLVQADKQLMHDHYMDTSELESEAELGRIMLEGYLEWVEDEGIDAELEMISTEEIISMPLRDGEVELQGKLDMRVRRKSDGVRLFRDFKTAASFSDYETMGHMNEQILTYMLLETAQEGDDKQRVDGGIFTLLKKVKRTANAKPPFYKQIEVRHNIFTLRSFWKRVNGTVDDMMNTRRQLDAGADPSYVAYPRPSRDCKWKCQFFAICPLIDDGSAAEQALSEMFQEADPYSYYGLQDETKGSE